jgi:hypothetical protein
MKAEKLWPHNAWVTAETSALKPPCTYILGQGGRCLLAVEGREKGGHKPSETRPLIIFSTNTYIRNNIFGNTPTSYHLAPRSLQHAPINLLPCR